MTTGNLNAKAAFEGQPGADDGRSHGDGPSDQAEYIIPASPTQAGILALLEQTIRHESIHTHAIRWHVKQLRAHRDIRRRLEQLAFRREVQP